MLWDGSFGEHLLSEGFDNMPVAGFKDLDLKDLNLCACESLDMNKEMEVIINMKNLEKLDISGTNISVLSEGDPTAQWVWAVGP